MKFGSVDNPEDIDLSLPGDHPGTKKILSDRGTTNTVKVYAGCAKWNRKDLKNFYPDGVDDELEYYARQFNTVELNATFYRDFPAEQIQTWCDKVPDGFHFCPKVNRYISHLKWLGDVEEAKERYIDSISHFKEKLGTVFLLLRKKFRPKFMGRVADFLESWPDELPLAIEFRHPDWFNDPQAAEDLYALLEDHQVANVITDTAGRRDLMHMRLTNTEAFIRYVGTSNLSDYTRLDDWVRRLEKWNDQGLSKLHFFVHQHEEEASPQLEAYFIKKLNKAVGTNVKVPDVEE
jgi:uncharacterized protein YecE (DUF72 family)